MQTIFQDDLLADGYMVMYIGNGNKAMTAQNRVTWWIVPGTLEV